MSHNRVTVYQPARRGSQAALRIVDAVLRIYQLLLSPLLGPSCRFAPSCSAYAREAVQRHGVVRGGLMALRRIARCHPFHAGGWDPVG